MVELTLILPVHNEAKGIEKNLEDIKEALQSLRISYEIICVENGSADDTFEVLQKLAKRDKTIRVIRSVIGWGSAVRAGIDHAKGTFTCYMISDGQIDPKYIRELYNVRSSYPLVKIWRTSRENSTRLTNSRIYNILARFLFGIDSKDVNATPKLIKTTLLQSIPLKSNNIALDLELLLALKQRSLRWLEIPAPSKKRNSGTSTTNLKSVWEMMGWMVKFKFHL